MSTGAALPLEAQLEVPALASTGRRRRARQPSLGAMLFEAQMTDVAAFDFLGGSVVVFTTRSPHKETPNEDVAALWPVGRSSGVLAVADGLGGHVGGERASRLAAEAIQKSLQEAAPAAEAAESVEL